MFTLGSLFDGIGGFPIAAVNNGIIPLWASEIEVFPIEVTKIRFPNMLHVGDITKLKGEELPPIDVISGGSPCQDLSVAGARAGLAGERSGLFMEQIRITKEMRNADARRCKTNHLVRPRYFIWENVPGAFSSTDGEDFKAVLEETTRIADSTVSIPRPPGGVWKSVGCILGDEFSIAWRVLDAQYWGVAQRRKRIFLVADFGGHTAPQILFEQDSLFGNYTESKIPWKGTATSTETGIDYTGRGIKPTICLNDQGGERMDITEDITSTLRASMGGNLPIVMGSQQGGAEITVGICPTITSAAGTSGNNQPVLFDNHAKDCRYNGPLHVAPTVAATYGTGGNNVPLVSKPIAFSLDSKDSNSMKSRNPNSGCRETHKARTIDTSNPDPSKNQGGIAIVQESYCIAGNTIDRQDHNGGNGCGFQENISYTLTTSDIHAVCSVSKTYQDKVGALCVGDEKGNGNQYVGQDKCIVDCEKMMFGQSEFANYKEGCATLRAEGGDNGGGSENLVATKNLVRRLTPLECERLQGFPDGWTNIKKSSDSARYKALGNSVAVPCVNFIMRGIACFLQKFKEEQEE